MDLDDLEHNTRDGLHIASLANAFIVAVAAFGGARDQRGALTFTPRLPQALSRLVIRIGYRGRLLKVDVTHSQARYTLMEGEPLEIEHHGQKLTIDGRALTRRIPPAPDLPSPKQPPGREPMQRRPLR
jgi:alpha,alpha-trehalose phosphorylase